MQFRFFMIPAADAGAQAEELNAFLRGHRVVSVQRELVGQAGGSCWAVCVEYLPPPPGGGRAPSNGDGKGKVDYRETLSADDFAVFARLRQVRKELAERDEVPVYAVFTNEQIAAMVTNRVDSLKALRGIDGVGEARVEKYGDLFLAALRAGAPTVPVPGVGGKEAAP